MKLVLISDLHANHKSVEGLLASEGSYDHLVCLGDYLDQGHHPDELITLMRRNKHLGVPGNHDFHMLDISDRFPELREFNDHDLRGFMLNEEWGRLSVASLSHENWAWFQELCAGPRHRVLEADGWSYLFTHAFCSEWVLAPDPRLVRAEYDIPEGKGDLVNFIKEVTGSYDPARRYRVCTGHRHYRWHLKLSENLEYLNPGSTAYMRKGDAMLGAEYIVIEDGEVSLRSHAYDWQALYAPGNDGPHDGCLPRPVVP